MIEVDPSSHTWMAVKAHVKAQIAKHDKVLRTIGLDPGTTEGLRYAIDELEGLLKLDKTSKMPLDTEL